MTRMGKASLAIIYRSTLLSFYQSIVLPFSRSINLLFYPSLVLSIYRSPHLSFYQYIVLSFSRFIPLWLVPLSLLSYRQTTHSVKCTWQQLQIKTMQPTQSPSSHPTPFQVVQGQQFEIRTKATLTRSPASNHAGVNPHL